jgi:signal transduction histidine kinase
MTPPSKRDAVDAAPAWSRRTELAAVLAFWTLLGALTLVRRVLDTRGPAGLTFPDTLFVVAEYALWALLTPAVFGLARRLPLERGAAGRRLAVHLSIALAVAAVLEVIRVGVLRPLLLPDGFFGPLPPGVPVPRFTPAGALLQMRFLDELVIYVAVLAAGFARDYFLRYRAHAAEAARLQAQLAEARLAALRMQLNPHFLFNTLHAVSALVERDPAGVRRLVARLSALLRHVLDSGTRQEVSLGEELAFLRDYLDIQQIRFQGRLEVDESVPDDLRDSLVPNLVLQPLVENAILHGVGRIEGCGRIDIAARRDGEYLVLTVRDNGPGVEGNGRTGGVGLANTRERLAALYGDDATLSLEPAPGGGLIAGVVLPYHTSGDLHAVAAEPALADA